MVETKRRARNPMWWEKRRTMLEGEEGSVDVSGMHDVSEAALYQLHVYMFLTGHRRALLIEVSPAGHVTTAVHWSDARWGTILGALEVTGASADMLTD